MAISDELAAESSNSVRLILDDVVLHNPHDPERRRFLIGSTDGGRALTLVIEQTVDPTTWLIVTGWDATAAERRILNRQR
jgi:hypothetical protein